MTDRMTKTNTPFPDEDRELIERLRQGGRADRSGYRYDNLPINPDGPAAADRLESLLSDRAKLEEALREALPFVQNVADGDAPSDSVGYAQDVVMPLIDRALNRSTDRAA